MYLFANPVLVKKQLNLDFLVKVCVNFNATLLQINLIRIFLTFVNGKKGFLEVSYHNVNYIDI